MTAETKPVLSGDDVIRQLELFKQTVATCFCAVPVLLSAPCLLLALWLSVFTQFFSDFNMKLPWAMQFVVAARPFWVLLSLAVPVAAFVVARKRSARFSILFSTLSGLVVFACAVFIAVSLFHTLFGLRSDIGPGAVVARAQ